MSVKLKQRELTPAEYLAIEEKAEFKSEYWDGVMMPLQGEPPSLAGASENQNLIVANLTIEIGLHLRGKDCRLYPNDMRVTTSDSNKFFYPDVTVVCDEPQFFEKRNDTVLNPVLIVEVLSKSTAAFDKTDKFLAYQQIESLQEYILADQNKAVVHQYIKEKDGGWRYYAYIGLDSSFYLSSIENCQLILRNLYDKIDFARQESSI